MNDCLLKLNFKVTRKFWIYKLTRWAKMALTHRILPELRSSINCLGWYWGRTGQARWLASNRPKSGWSSGSLDPFSLVGETTTKILNKKNDKHGKKYGWRENFKCLRMIHTSQFSNRSLYRKIFHRWIMLWRFKLACLTLQTSLYKSDICREPLPRVLGNLVNSVKHA